MEIIYTQLKEIFKKHYFNLLYCVLLVQFTGIFLRILNDTFPVYNFRFFIFSVLVFLLQMGITLGVIRCCLQILDTDQFKPTEIFKQFDLLSSYISSTVIVICLGILIFLPALVSLYRTSNYSSFLNQNISDIKATLESFVATMGEQDTLYFFIASILYLYISFRFYFAAHFIVDQKLSGLNALRMSFSYTKGKFSKMVPMYVVSSIVPLVLVFSGNIFLFFFLPITIILPTIYYRHLQEL